MGTDELRAVLTVKTASREKLALWVEDALTCMGFDHDHDLTDAHDYLGRLPQWGTFHELVEMAKREALAQPPAPDAGAEGSGDE
jgi:hypothetical protein